MTPSIRDAAARLLLDQRLSNFYSMGLMELRDFRGGFLIDSYASFEQKSGMRLPLPTSPHLRPCGMTVRAPLLHGRALILYDERLSRPRLAFTLAHEMGHLMLGHHKTVGRGADPLSPPYDLRAERASDAFAACLLMPPVLILAWEEWTGRRMEEDELMSCFPVSAMAARRQRMAVDRLALDRPALDRVAVDRPAVDRLRQGEIALSRAERTLATRLFAPLTDQGGRHRKPDRFNHDSTVGMDNQTAGCLTRHMYP